MNFMKTILSDETQWAVSIYLVCHFFSFKSENWLWFKSVTVWPSTPAVQLVRHCQLCNSKFVFAIKVSRFVLQHFDGEICKLLGYWTVYSGKVLTNVSGQPIRPICKDWPFKMGPIFCPETSVTCYKYSLRNIPEERRSHLLYSGNLKQCIFWWF
jgi:hypothetical protein